LEPTPDIAQEGGGGGDDSGGGSTPRLAMDAGLPCCPNRLGLYYGLVARDTLMVFLAIQLIIYLLGIACVAADPRHSLRTWLTGVYPGVANPNVTTAYFYGMLLLLGSMGFFATVGYLCGGRDDVANCGASCCFQCCGGAGHTVRGAHAARGTSAATAGGSGHGTATTTTATHGAGKGCCGCFKMVTGILVAATVVFVVLGVLVGLFFLSIVGQRILLHHAGVLERRQLARHRYVVANMLGKDMSTIGSNPHPISQDDSLSI
jgi:hypothetical protein